MADPQPKPYPGYNNYESPRANARVKPEAEQYANNGRGSINLFASTPRYVDEIMPEPKCPSGEAKRNYELGRHGTVNALLYGQATPRTDVAVQRVSDAARPIAEGHAGKQTANLFYSYGNQERSAPDPLRVKPEAADTAEQHKGGRMDCLLHAPAKLPSSARAPPRVKNEAAANAELGKGGQMSQNLHSYGSATSREAQHPRVKPEASENAEKGKGYMGTLMGKYGKLPLDTKPEPKVRGQGQDYANLDQGGRMSRLVYEGSRLPQDPKPPPRATSKEAKHIVKANRGQMAKIFAAQGKRQNVATPGLKASQSLKIY